MYLSLTEPTTVPSRASSLMVKWYWLLGRNSGLLSLASRSFSSILAQDSESDLKSGESGESGAFLASVADRSERGLRRLEDLLRFSSILLLRRLGERRRRFERLLFTRCSLDSGSGVVVVAVVVVVVFDVVVPSKSSSLSCEGPPFLLVSGNTRDSLLESSLDFLSPAAFPLTWASVLL